MTQINNIVELADQWCWRSLSEGVTENAEELAERSISRALFKYTSCGASFWRIDNGVGVAGYCEGSDYEIPPHTLTFPFLIDEFERAVEQADLDGCEMWNQTHACEKCNPEGSLDIFENEYPPGEVGGPINPSCEACSGHGAVM